METKRKNEEDAVIDYPIDYMSYNKKIKLHNEREYIEELLKQDNENKTMIENLVEKIKEQNYIITNLIEQIEEKESIITNISNITNITKKDDKYNLYT